MSVCGVSLPHRASSPVADQQMYSTLVHCAARRWIRGTGLRLISATNVDRRRAADVRPARDQHL